MKIVPILYRENGAISFDGFHSWSEHEHDQRQGFVLTFARLYARDRLAANRKLLIIPAAKGGKSILEWEDRSSTAPLPLYWDMMQRISFARSQPGKHRIVAMLWHQGESDVGLILRNQPSMDASIYRQHLRSHINRVRADLGMPGLPFVAGRFAPEWLTDDEAGFRVKKQIEGVIAQVISMSGRAAIVPTGGLASNKAFSAHFNAAAQITLGERYFAAWSAQ